MLRIISARENIDKERFIYEHISGETLVLVPNQYTLVAEEQALHYTNSKCLFDTEILSMNRLGLRILMEQGLESTKMLDRYGRFMLLNRIIKSHKTDLEIFAKSAGKVTFATMISDFISDFKQQSCTIEELKSMLDDDSTDALLKAKLGELEAIICEYEQSIDGLYTDSEDYIAMYIDAIKDSKIVKDKTVWIYGYDSVTPKFIAAMIELAKVCENVNFVANLSDFILDDIVIDKITQAASESQLGIEHELISEDYQLEKSETIRRIERGLFNDNLTDAEIRDNAGFVPEDLTLVRAANPYYEAETAAIYIYHLIRDLGYKMKDIQIIANDETIMQPIIRRTFEEYGLKLFMDQSRNITDSPVVSFIVNMLWFIKYGKSDQLISMLKTGFAGVDYEDIENLENYARIYHIKGNMWKSAFKYGAEALGEEKFAKLESIRQQIMEPISRLEAITKSETVGDFVLKFKELLEEEWCLSEQVEKVVNEQSEHNSEESQRTAQSYQSAMKLLDQIVQIMGGEKFEPGEFIDVYMTGLTNVEVGVIPPTVDGLSMGTMIRTRPRASRAVVVLGANEGTLPMQPSAEGLFSIDEKSYFKEQGFAIGGLDDIKMNEENVAMYRMLSKPSEKLYISYAMTDAEGAETSPSTIIESLEELFPRIKTEGLIQKDAISCGWGPEIISSDRVAMRHLLNHLKDKNTEIQMDDVSDALMTWFENTDSELMKEMIEIAKNENDPKPVGNDIAGKLYSKADGNIALSASALSNYFECPFKYYVDKGLKPQEEREFSSDPRSIGEVYHSCLEMIARKIIADKSFGEKLLQLSDDELEKTVSEELSNIAENYQGGLFVSSGNEEYRMDRIREICATAVKALAKQLVADSVTGGEFETNFGRNCRFKPIEFEVDGQKIYVEGKIDRVDFLGGDKARIIDYKTGPDKFEPWKVQHGYGMQLMIYMISAMDEYEPAGVFYFNLHDLIEPLNDKDETKNGGSILDGDPVDKFKLNGKYINEPGMLELMPADVLSGKADAAAISKDEFMELRNSVINNMKEIASGIAGGRIDINPLKKDSNKLVCNFCRYRAICRRDRDYVRNYSRAIPAKPKKKKEPEA